MLRSGSRSPQAGKETTIEPKPNDRRKRSVAELAEVAVRVEDSAAVGNLVAVAGGVSCPYQRPDQSIGVHLVNAVVIGEKKAAVGGGLDLGGVVAALQRSLGPCMADAECRG